MRASGCASARLGVSVPAIPPRTWKLKWTAEASVRDTRGRFVRAVDDPLQIAGHRHRFMHRGNAGFSAPRECAPSIMSGLHHRLSNRDGGEVVFDAMHADARLDATTAAKRIRVREFRGLGAVGVHDVRSIVRCREVS